MKRECDNLMCYAVLYRDMPFLFHKTANIPTQQHCVFEHTTYTVTRTLNVNVVLFISLLVVVGVVIFYFFFSSIVYGTGWWQAAILLLVKCTLSHTHMSCEPSNTESTDTGCCVGCVCSVTHRRERTRTRTRSHAFIRAHTLTNSNR